MAKYWIQLMTEGVTLSSFLVLLIVVPVAIATLVLFVELFATVLAKKNFFVASDVARPSIVVLVPAHNESRGLLPTLNDITAQLQRGDRLLVVADNCSDDTADVAEAAGAEVIRRSDPQKTGKGYALDFGLCHLRDSLSEVVVMIDADCRLDPGALSQLALTCSLTGRPAQALYLMTSPEGAMISHRLAEFAWRIKNDLRPHGLAALGMPCQLMGSGMAFPRKVIGVANLASGHLAEDLDLGLQLAAAGHASVFCPTAVVRSEFPSTGQAEQRQRWQHGHLTVLVKRALPSIWVAARSRNWNLLALSLDAAVPPLILLGLLVAGTFAVSCLAGLMGGAIGPLLLSGTVLVFFTAALFIAWTKCGRDLLLAETFGSVVPYIIGKFPIYARAFAADKKWTRTDRSKPT
jgi:cellulose synthase/poly-beta-1,6-N-acetylglucosamine synthase-like glycosyltransferase